MLCLLLHVTFLCCLLSLDVTFASIFKSHMYHKSLHEHTRMSHRLLLLSWSFSPLLFSLLSVEKWSHTLKIYLLVICEVLRAVFSYQWVLQSFAMPGFTRWPKGEPDTEHSWTHWARAVYQVILSAPQHIKLPKWELGSESGRLPKLRQASY